MARRRNPARPMTLADWRALGAYDCEHGFDPRAFQEARRDRPFANAKQLVDHVWVEDRAQVFEEWLANRGSDYGLTRATGREAFAAWAEGWRSRAVDYVLELFKKGR